MEENKVDKKVVLDTTNPFNTGVSYDMFLENVNAKNSVDNMLNKHKLSDGEKEYIKKELKEYKELKKK